MGRISVGVAIHSIAALAWTQAPAFATDTWILSGAMGGGRYAIHQLIDGKLAFVGSSAHRICGLPGGKALIIRGDGTLAIWLNGEGDGKGQVVIPSEAPVVDVSVSPEAVRASIQQPSPSPSKGPFGFIKNLGGKALDVVKMVNPVNIAEEGLKKIGVDAPPVVKVITEPVPTILTKGLEKATDNAGLAKSVGSLASPIGAPSASAVETNIIAGMRLVQGVESPGRIPELVPQAARGVIESEIKAGKPALEVLKGVAKKDLEQAGNGVFGLLTSPVDRHLNPGLVGLSQPFMVPVIPPSRRETLMTEPACIPINSMVYSGSPVFYVNGMCTPRGVAEDEARLLSDHLRRPVQLIYNETNGPLADFAEAVYDRTWPFLNLTGPTVEQVNPTTRQITHLLHHRVGRVTLVAHSQGVLCARNAILTAHAFGDEGLQERVALVATGLPMRDDEIYPKYKFRAIAHADDPVSQIVGQRLVSDQFMKQNLTSHEFSKYVPEIHAEDVP